jgi:hypothetical protein
MSTEISENDIKQKGEPAAIAQQNPNSDVERDAAAPPEIVLKVIDAPFDGSQPNLMLESFKDQDLKTALGNLPKHESGARIFDFTIDEKDGERYTTNLEVGCKFPDTAPESILVSFLTQTYTKRSSWPHLLLYFKEVRPASPTLSPDPSSIFAQWNQDIKYTEIPSGFTISSTLKKKNYPFGLSPYDWNKYTFVTESSHIICFKDGEERSIVLIINEAQATQKLTEGGFMFENNRCSTILLNHTGWNVLADGSLVHFTKLLILEFILSCFFFQETKYYLHLILPDGGEGYETWASEPQIYMITPIYHTDISRTDTFFLTDMVDTLTICETICEQVEACTEVVLLLIRVLSQKQTSQKNIQASDGDVFEHIHYDRFFRLVEHCKARRAYTKRKLEQVARIFSYQNTASDLLQASSVKRLTVLASFLIPLSVASSVLGMQTRFVDLHLLLYDLIGVTVLLFAIMLLLFPIIQIDFYWKQIIGSFKRNLLARKENSYFYSGRSSWKFWGVLSTLTKLSAFAIILVSFTVGMTSNIVVGLKILGFGFAGLFGVMMSTTFFITVYELFRMYKFYKSWHY